MIKLSRGVCPNPQALAKKDYKNPENKEELKKSTHWKCMYCESKMLHISYSDVEHIKPKSLYPNLEFDWNNLWIACDICNRKYKADQDEDLINPYDVDPSNHISFSWAILYDLQWDTKWRLSIDCIWLNRAELVAKRQEKIDEINKAIQACFRASNETIKNNALCELKKEWEGNREYSMCVSTFLKGQNI